MFVVFCRVCGLSPCLRSFAGFRALPCSRALPWCGIAKRTVLPWWGLHRPFLGLAICAAWLIMWYGQSCGMADRMTRRIMWHGQLYGTASCMAWLIIWHVHSFLWRGCLLGKAICVVCHSQSSPIAGFAVCGLALLGLTICVMQRSWAFRSFGMAYDLVQPFVWCGCLFGAAILRGALLQGSVMRLCQGAASLTTQFHREISSITGCMESPRVWRH